jgi:hypothetical protein
MVERRRLNLKRRRPFIPSRWHIAFTDSGEHELFLSDCGRMILRAPKQSPLTESGQRAGQIVVSGISQVEDAIRARLGVHPERAGLTPWVEAKKKWDELLLGISAGTLAVGKYGHTIKREKTTRVYYYVSKAPVQRRRLGAPIQRRRLTQEHHHDSSHQQPIIRRRRLQS